MYMMLMYFRFQNAACDLTHFTEIRFDLRDEQTEYGCMCTQIGGSTSIVEQCVIRSYSSFDPK